MIKFLKRILKVSYKSKKIKKEIEDFNLWLSTEEGREALKKTLQKNDSYLFVKQSNELVFFDSKGKSFIIKLEPNLNRKTNLKKVRTLMKELNYKPTIC